VQFGMVQCSVVEVTGGGLGALATATAWRSGPQSFLLGGGPTALQRAFAAAGGAAVDQDGNGGGGVFAFVVGFAPPTKLNGFGFGFGAAMTRRDLDPSSSELSGISIAFSGDDAGGGLSPSSSELSWISIALSRDDIVMACVRRLAGDGVYWDRLRVSGRVRGATCAAPRKNRPTSLRGAFPSSRAANLTTTRDAPPSAGPPPQPLDGRAAAPRRAPPGTGTGSPMALFLRCWTATRPRGRRPRGLSRAGTH